MVKCGEVFGARKPPCGSLQIRQKTINFLPLSSEVQSLHNEGGQTTQARLGAHLFGLKKYLILISAHELNRKIVYMHGGVDACLDAWQ